MLVDPRERQEVLHELAHADRFALDPAHRGCHVLVLLQGTVPVELGEAADRDQRGPELVGRVCDETAHLALRRGPGGEGRLDMGEHRVE